MKKSLFENKKIPQESLEIIKNFDKIAESVRPLNSKQKHLLPTDIKNLSHNLTDTRGQRRLGYMNSHQEISAYINYFLWWNLVRLVPLFSGLEFSVPSTTSSEGKENEIVALDIGSGPLTIPIALWLACPNLRGKKIKFYCLDMSQNALSVGEELFLKIAAKTLSVVDSVEDCAPWKIIRVKGDLGTEIKEKADLIFSANVFNEVIQNETKPLDFLAKKNCEAILRYAKPEAKIFITEPGVPRSARFISLLRDQFLRKNFVPLAPCPHVETCPMQGRTPQGKAFNKNEKWCNFAFSTESAPEKLLKLSERANLKKDRAVLSFIFVERGGAELSTSERRNHFDKPNDRCLSVRVCSDSIFIPYLKKSGFYCCSEKGMLLLVGDEKLKNGDLTEIKDFDAKKCQKDEKSGAIIVKTHLVPYPIASNLCSISTTCKCK